MNRRNFLQGIIATATLAWAPLRTVPVASASAGVLSSFVDFLEECSQEPWMNLVRERHRAGQEWIA